MFTIPEFVIWGFVSFLLYIPLTFSRLLRSDVRRSYQQYLRGINLSKQLVIVTGSNTGIGKETARALACLGGHVILACRDSLKAKDACLEIMSDLKNASSLDYPYASDGKISHLRLDLSSLASVVAFVDEVKSSYQRVDILVNNAGTNAAGDSDDHIEQVFQINYLGHFLLTVLLEPLLSYKLSKSDQSVGRIVNLSSVMHHLGGARFQEENYLGHSKPKKYEYYSDSKLYMNYLSMEVNRRFGGIRAGRPIRAVSCNPGAVRSDIWRHVPKLVMWIYDTIMKLIYLSVEQGSLTSIHAAVVADADLQSYQMRFKHLLPESDQQTCRWTYHPYLPYVVPYQMYLQWLCFEMIGPLAYPSFSAVTLPKNSNELAKQLWSFSAKVCLGKLKSKVDVQKYDELVRLLAHDEEF
jgi:NAD(P)-dependent dehydrogenase (short-subunit alcohol dehydrogenase family)